ncbi:phage tail protein [Citrobacter portucalensis]|uniref:phage tail protein n=1 Tax=Citrobacter portucalensis TaxID=1639133 RepID=UPI002019D835|nr:phage tail protein [Citrobacter portucalensis]UQQ22417.1 phage tail protein [Citrobacter portucalensis]
MHRIDTPTAQKDKFGAGKNGFTRGNPQTGTPATDLDDDYFDMLQEELAGVVEATGVNLEKSKHNQLLTALKALLLSRAHPFADIKADGSAAIAEALSNLGLDVVVNGGSQVWLTSSSGKYHIFIGEDGSWGMWNEENSQNVPLSIIGGGTGGNTKQEAQLNLGLGCGLPPIGIPFYWPSAAMPNTVIPEWSGMTFLKLNGATFTAAQYPKLALVWPGLKLTETRGEFIRVADDGRGVDTGRALLSAQGDAMRNLTGNIEGRTAGSIGRIFSNNANGVFSATGEGGDFITPTSTSGAPGDRLSNLNLDASRQVSTANEFRPRNVAFNFLVRAA